MGKSSIPEGLGTPFPLMPNSVHPEEGVSDSEVTWQGALLLSCGRSGRGWCQSGLWWKSESLLLGKSQSYLGAVRFTSNRNSNNTANPQRTDV